MRLNLQKGIEKLILDAGDLLREKRRVPFEERFGENESFQSIGANQNFLMQRNRVYGKENEVQRRGWTMPTICT